MADTASRLGVAEAAAAAVAPLLPRKVAVGVYIRPAAEVVAVAASPIVYEILSIAVLAVVEGLASDKVADAVEGRLQAVTRPDTLTPKERRAGQAVCRPARPVGDVPEVLEESVRPRLPAPLLAALEAPGQLVATIFAEHISVGLAAARQRPVCIVVGPAVEDIAAPRRPEARP